MRTNLAFFYSMECANWLYSDLSTVESFEVCMIWLNSKKNKYKIGKRSRTYLLAQVFEQNLFDPLNWLAGARLPQYSHFNTEEEEGTMKLCYTFKRFWPCTQICGIIFKSKSYSTTHMEVHSLSGRPGQNLCLWGVQQPVKSNTSLIVRNSLTWKSRRCRCDLMCNVCYHSTAHLQGKAQLPPGSQSPLWGGWGLEVWPLPGEQALCCLQAPLLTRAEAKTGWEETGRQPLQKELVRKKDTVKMINLQTKLYN